MSLQLDSWAVTGATTSATLARLQLRSATRSGQGIIESGDMRVAATDTPGTSVLVKGGAAVVRGAEVLYQGSYYAYNIGDATVSIDAASTARSDLVYLRVEDPTFAGSPWTHNVTTEPIYYFTVAKDVGAGATTVPSGESGIPLARIDIPPSTGTIEDSMITDLRDMMDARTKVEIFTRVGSWNSTDDVGNTSDWEQFPNGASWIVNVPEWASRFQVMMTWNQLQFISDTEARGNLSGLLTVGSNTVRTNSTIYDTHGSGGNLVKNTRMTVASSDWKNIPSDMRGQSGTFEMQGENDGTHTGHLQFDGGASVSMIIEWIEQPTYDPIDRSAG